MMNVAPITADGWKFEFADSQLIISSEQESHLRVQLSAKAAFSLLDYLYHERDKLQEATQRETSEEIDLKKAETRNQSIQGEGMIS